MAHPQRFDEDDPVLARVREICLALPGADIKVSHGRPAFFTTKIFTIYGAEANTSEYDQSIVIKPDPDEAEALTHDDRFFTPKYWGPTGWIALDLASAVDWGEVGELVEVSFRLTAPKTLIAELD